MNLKVRLKSPQYCNKCPCLHHEHFVNGRIGDAYCKYKKGYKVKEDSDFMDYCYYIRPKKCVRENRK